MENILKIANAIFLLVCYSTVFAQEYGFYDTEPSGRWILDLVDDSGVADADCSREQFDVIKKARADDYACFVDLGYPGRPFDQDVATHTMIDTQQLPGQYAQGKEPSPTPEFSGFENTMDGHKATLVFGDGYTATIDISPYGSVAVYGRYKR